MKKVIVLCFLLLIPFSVSAKVKVEKRIKYYDIYPKSKKDIKTQLLSKSPIKKSGEKLYADTVWEVNTSYEYKGKCRVTKVYVDLNIKTILPRLTPKKSVKFSVKNPFSKFERKLISYQKKHEKFAVQAAKEIEKKLLSYGSPRDCDKFRKQIRVDKKKIIKKYRKKSKEYDKKTDYGRKKGVKI
ncbi:DUF922 domain-containing protein [Arcobacter sp. LA11]|uniref:DUF922 domain-containing protein n=1 Tax=Arcobacter sp. LA11 TaxID=1898176 RepID=UPI0009350A2B|nr:DUF922 domain-containing protein [Arcobacter sp. LA11]